MCDKRFTLRYNLSRHIRGGGFLNCLVEEADIWWWVVATNFNVSSRQKFKFYGLSVAFRGHLVANPCLNFCLSITKIIHMEYY